MSLSGIFARIVALIGAAAVLWRRLQGVPREAAWGSAPFVPAAKPQGSIPTLKMPTARVVRRAEARGAPGLKVNAFATGLEHPRWITCCPMATSSLPRRRRSPAGQERVRLCDAGDDAARRGARRQRQPHHAAARPDGDGVAETRRPSWRD
jgi:glucose/arabinose dehydrogenase